MGDSDEDHDRHSRDKFKRERNDYSFKRSADYESSASSNWMNAGDRYTNRNSGRDSFGRDQKPNGNYGPRNRYNDMSPPMKRFRNRETSWNDREYSSDRSFNRNTYNSSFDTSLDNNASSRQEEPTQPLMLNFKQFMNNLDDSIDHIEATTKYNNYKIEFKKKQLTEFFNAHKEEEWFRLKYHPEDSIKRKKKLRDFLVSRRECFINLLKKGQIDSISLDVDKIDSITRLLDIVIIQLEGGDENDIRALDEAPKEEKSKEPELDLFSVDVDDNQKSKSTKITPSNNNGLSENLKNEKRMNVDGEENDEDEEMIKRENEDLDVQPVRPKRKYLHKTSSIFLRNLPANITIEEIEQMFKKYPEFLRVAISEPQIDKKFQRKAWVSFERTFDVRDIYLSLNNVKIRDIEIGAIINKDLSRRVRTVNGIASHKNCVLADIRHAAKIVAYLDHQKKIWQQTEEDERPLSIQTEALKMFGVESRNPLLRNITEFLIEEASAEEEELLGAELSTIDGDDQTLERNEHSIKVLDRLIYYLRIVHSFDYYNACEYPNEDEMPNRIGLIHVRGLPPSLKVQQKDVDNYIKTFEQKITPFTQPTIELTEDEIVKLGLRDEEAEVEKFIQENTQEISSDKWLCPLSGKKFKGPDFIRKHLLNKHIERLDEVRQEAKYFNNYLRDVKRMQLPEHPANRPPVPQASNTNKDNNNWTQNPSNTTTHDSSPFTSPFQMRAYSRLVAQPARLLGRKDPREIIGYNDLDDKLEMI